MRAELCLAAFGLVPVAMAGVIPRGATPPPGWGQPGYDPSAPVYGTGPNSVPQGQQGQQGTKSPSWNPPSYPNQGNGPTVPWTHEAKGTQPGHEWPSANTANTANLNTYSNNQNSNKNNNNQGWQNLPSHPAKGTQKGHEWYPTGGQAGSTTKSPSQNPPSRPPPAAFGGQSSNSAMYHNAKGTQPGHEWPTTGNVQNAQQGGNTKSPSWDPPSRKVDPDAMKKSGGLEQTEQNSQADRDAFGNVLKMVDFSGPQKPKCQNPEKSGTLRMNPDKIKSAVSIFCEELIENKTVLKEGGRGVKPVKAKGKGAVENDGVINMSVMYHKASCPKDRSRDSVDFTKISKNWCVSHVADLLLESCQDKSNKEFSALGGAYAMDCMLISVVGQAP